VAEAPTLRLWAGRGIYLLVAMALLFLRLLPIGHSPSGLPGPDLLVAVTFAWLLRRPDQVPLFSIAAVFLLADMLFLRVPGLWALIMLLASEFIRRKGVAGDVPFPAEWAAVSGVLVVSVLLEDAVLFVLMVPKVGTGVALLQMLVTIALYPAVALALRLGLGLRRIIPGETDRYGRAL